VGLICHYTAGNGGVTLELAAFAPIPKKEGELALDLQKIANQKTVKCISKQSLASLYSGFHNIAQHQTWKMGKEGGDKKR
jgi:hypothetical protein